jgi:hypothetical protein
MLRWRRDALIWEISGHEHVTAASTMAFSPPKRDVHHELLIFGFFCVGAGETEPHDAVDETLIRPLTFGPSLFSGSWSCLLLIAFLTIAAVNAIRCHRLQVHVGRITNAQQGRRVRPH